MPREFVCANCEETVHTILKVGEEAVCPACGTRAEVTVEMPRRSPEPPTPMPFPPADPRERLAKAEAEIAKLKTRLVTWKLTMLLAPILGAAAAIGWLALADTARFDEIRARTVQVGGGPGEPGLLLRMNDENEPVMSLHGPAGECRMLLTAGEDGSLLSLSPEGGETTLLLATSPGDPIVALRDGTGHTRATFSLGGDGNPRLIFWDEEKRMRASLHLVEGESGLALFDGQGQARVRALCPEEGAATLESEQ